MKNLHLMWMDSGFNRRLAEVLNLYFPHESNRFIWRSPRTFPQEMDNAVLDPSQFTVEAINRLSRDWDHIVLHSLWLKEHEIPRLKDEAASKIIWVVWGHDLYKKLPTLKPNLRSIAKYCYEWLRQRSVFYYIARKRVDRKIAKFSCIAIGYPYDEHCIRKRFGPNVPVKYGPYFSKDVSKEHLELLRKLHCEDHHQGINIMIGHCGSAFLQHEKYLKKLAKYKNENIHIYLIMSYLASPKKIAAIRALAQSIYREDQFTIMTKSMPQDKYFRYLTKMDVGIFAFRIQSALGNTKRLAYMGAKLYFDPHGVLAKGFREGGYQSFDCRKIGKISFEEFSRPAPLPDANLPLFEGFDVGRCVAAWEKLLYHT